MFGLFDGEEIMTLSSFCYRHVTDGQTDGDVAVAKSVLCIALRGRPKNPMDEKISSNWHVGLHNVHCTVKPLEVQCAVLSSDVRMVQ